MQMTEAYASAVTVSIPIFVLAAGAEARAVRERLKRPDEQWEREFTEYRAEHDPDMTGRPAEVLRYFRGAPWVSRLYLAERLMAVAAALGWLVVFVLLAVAELRSLVWLGDGSPPGASGLATFVLISIVVAMAALIVAPAAYLLVPLTLPLDLMPKGLKDDVKAKLTTEKGRNVFRLMLNELEGALDRAVDQVEQADAAAPEPAAGGPAAAEPAAAADPPGQAE